MDLDEHTGVDDNLERSCAVCGAALSKAEIEVSRESGGRFLCSTHASEEEPVDAEPIAGDQPGELTG
jgi:hypothetical protein